MGVKVDVMDEFYKLLHPCLAVFVVSASAGGRPNLMTCAWNMPVSEDPPMVAVALGEESYTGELIRESREFTVNIPGERLLKALWVCGTRSGRRADKFRLAGLTPRPARRVKPPIIDECMGHLECRLSKSVEAGECTLFIGEVLEAYASEEFFKNGVWDVRAASLPLHLGGRLFAIPSRVVKP